MTSIADRIRDGDPTALDDADVIEWCMDDPIGRALVDRVRALEAERDDAENAVTRMLGRAATATARAEAAEAELDAAEEIIRPVVTQERSITGAIEEAAADWLTNRRNARLAATPPREVDR